MRAEKDRTEEDTTPHAREPEWNALALRLSGLSPFRAAWGLQQSLWTLRRKLEIQDTLILLEHLPVVTIGKHGDERHVCFQSDSSRAEVVRVDRGGDVTYHGPGQLTAYFICDLSAHDLNVRAYVERLEDAVVAALAEFGIAGERRRGLTGVWARDGAGWAKVAALGVRVAHHTSLHGIALNVFGGLSGFGDIVPCGLVGERVTSVEALSGRAPAIDEAAAAVTRGFAAAFDLSFHTLERAAINGEGAIASLTADVCAAARRVRKPRWLRAPLPAGAGVARVRGSLAAARLHTVCASARCPNQHECWSAGTATFLILGDRCTRRCRFCAVAKAPPASVDASEPARVAAAVERLALDYVVVTSVTRDDLEDGGASIFAATVSAIRARKPRAKIELLIPDFAGRPESLAEVLDVKPTVLNHNVETVPRLYPFVRPGADFARSLAILNAARARGIPAKSGLMAGLGESDREIHEVLRMLRENGCERVTIGQYLQPTRDSLPVSRYLTPAHFDALRGYAAGLGFRGASAGPLVRSSYRAECADG